MATAEFTAYCLFVLEIDSSEKEDGNWIARISWKKDPSWSKIFESATKDEALSQANKWITSVDPLARISAKSLSEGTTLP